MNTLYLIATEKIGGAERVLLNIVEGLPKDTYQHFLITQEEGPLTDNFLRLGGRVFIFKLPAWRKFKNTIKRYVVVYKIARIVKKEGINLIYANTYRLNPYALYVSQICKIPSVVHIHEIIEKKDIKNFILHKAPYIIVPSDYVSRFLDNIRSKIFLIPNAVKVDEFLLKEKGSIRREFGIEPNTFLIGMVANFVEKKGHRFFIEAASLVKEKLHNVRFIIVGDNVYGSSLTKEILQKFAQEKNILDNIIFTGLRHDVPKILNDLDIFILPSEKESFSLAIIEAMAAKVPVIAHKFSGGPVEIIEDGKDGLLVDCTNPKELADKILNLIERRDFRKELVEEAYKKVRKHFDMPIFIDNIKKALEKIIKNEKAS